MNTPSVPQRHTLIFRKKSVIAHQTYLFSFEKPQGFTFVAGQFATVRIPSIADVGNPAESVHALSFASAPSDEDIAFAWRSSNSPFKTAAEALQPGDAIEMIAPAGAAVVPEDAVHIVFFIGGIGITPVRSILRQAQHDGARQQRYTLFYSNRTPQDAPFFDEMDHYSNVCRVIHTMTEPCSGWSGETGFIDESLVRKHVRNYSVATYYVVGAGGFVRAMDRVVESLGVPHERIICDNFG